MKISVITSVFNGISFLKDCLESILNQTHQELEIIIIDGGSTDGSRELIGHYQNRITKTIFEADRGIYDALNKGIVAATGDVISFLHADDRYAHASVLERVAERFQDQTVETCYGDLIYEDRLRPGKIVRYWRSGAFRLENFKRGWMPPHLTFFAKRELYQRYGGFDLCFKIAADYELMTRFLYLHQVPAVYLPEVLVRMRLGGMSNRNALAILQKSWEDYRICREYGLGWQALVAKNLIKLPQFFDRAVMPSPESCNQAQEPKSVLK